MPAPGGAPRGPGGPPPRGLADPPQKEAGPPPREDHVVPGGHLEDDGLHVGEVPPLGVREAIPEARLFLRDVLELHQAFAEPLGGLGDDLPIRELPGEGPGQLAPDLVPQAPERLRNGDNAHGRPPAGPRPAPPPAFASSLVMHSPGRRPDTRTPSPVPPTSGGVERLSRDPIQGHGPPPLSAGS